MSSPRLGEAAHRLLKNTLNLKSNHNYSGSVEQPSHRNSSSNQVNNRPRAAGPSGYGRRFIEDRSSYCGNYDQGHEIAGSPRPAFSPYEWKASQQNLRTQERYLHQEQQTISPYQVQGNTQKFRTQDQEKHHRLQDGMSSLTIGEINTRPPALMSPRIPNSGQFPINQNQFVQNSGPLPAPPPKWIVRQTAGNSGTCYKQQTSSPATLEKQVKNVYQAKSQEPPEFLWLWIWAPSGGSIFSSLVPSLSLPFEQVCPNLRYPAHINLLGKLDIQAPIERLKTSSFKKKEPS